MKKIAVIVLFGVMVSVGFVYLSHAASTNSIQSVLTREFQKIMDGNK